jgi:hypothetical protein
MIETRAKIDQSCGEKEILAIHAKIPVDDVQVMFSDNVKNLPVHAVCVDHEGAAVVLVVRGSLSMFDFYLDAMGEYVDYTYIDPTT